MFSLQYVTLTLDWSRTGTLSLSLQKTLSVSELSSKSNTALLESVHILIRFSSIFRVVINFQGGHTFSGWSSDCFLVCLHKTMHSQYLGLVTQACYTIVKAVTVVVIII